MMEFRKNSEADELIRGLQFPPCEISAVPNERRKEFGGISLGDGVLQISWGKYQGRYVYVFREIEDPKALREAALLARSVTLGRQLPLVIAPRLSEDALNALEELGVSGIDLRGNGLLLDPPRLMMRRTGSPPPVSVPSEPSISANVSPRRNVYHGVTSLVPRLLLTQPVFPSPSALFRECKARMGGATKGGVLMQSTVSKALAQMEADLFIKREGTRGSIRIVRPAELLDQLVKSYVAPKVTGQLLGKPKDPREIQEKIRALAEARGISFVVSGLGSAVYHTAMAGLARLQMYVSQISPFIDADLITPTVAFPSIELIETGDTRVFFDARDDGVTPWSSPIQTYLELVSGGPREQTTANELRRTLLHRLELNP